MSEKSTNTDQFPPLDPLDEKIRDRFRGRVVRKSYAATIPVLDRLPRYIAEYLINKHADEDGFLQEDVLEQIVNDLKKFLPDKREKEAFKSRALELGFVDVIGHFEVRTDLRRSKYRTHVNALDEKATVDRTLVSPMSFPDLLKGGLWGKATFEHLRTGDGANLNMKEFESYQDQKPTLARYIRARKALTTDEWIDFLIKTIGLDPAVLSKPQKMFYLARMIPLVERSTNIIEMGPPGTGKSHTFENLSFYTRVVLGGDISEARFIYNSSTRENGIIFNYDMICFDEINKSRSHLTTLVPKLQQIMASNKVERGELDTRTDVSLVFQGNIDFIQNASGNAVPKNHNHFQDIPNGMQDPPFLDRIHAYIPGWKLPTVSDMHLNRKLGLISNYFGEILHKLRGENFTDLVDKNISFSTSLADGTKTGITLRDLIAVKHLLSGYLKLVFPHRELTDAEWTEITTLSVALRQNMLDEIKKLDGKFNRTINFELLRDQATPNAMGDEPIKVEEPMVPKGGEAAPTIEKNIPLEKGDLSILDDHVPINDEFHLAGKIPYWMLKILVANDLLVIKPPVFKIRDKLGENGIESVSTGEVALSTIEKDPSAIQFEEEEKILGEIQEAMEELTRNYDDLVSKFIKLRQLQLLIDDADPKGLPLFEKIETKEIAALSRGGYSNVMEIKDESKYIEVILERIMKSQGLNPNIIDYQDTILLKSSTEIKDAISGKTSKLKEMLDIINIALPVLKQEVEEVFPRSHPDTSSPTDLPFKGEKFSFFAFDVNNLHNSMRNKIESSGSYSFPGQMERKIVNALKSKVLPRGGNYLAFFFASKGYLQYKSKIPQSKNVKWFIESTVKKWDSGKPKYVDIDTLLVHKTSIFIDRYHEQIESFMLGSGDKDFHPVVQEAIDHGIPVKACVIDEQFLSNKIRYMVNEDVTIIA